MSIKIQGKISLIKNALLADIRSGELLPGARIPSRSLCMERFSCARASVDRAVNELIADGVLYARQGAGTYVAEQNDTFHEIKQIYVIYNSDSHKDGFFAPGSVEDALRRDVPVTLLSASRIGAQVNKIARPGNMIIWKYPGYKLLSLLDFFANSNVPQIMIGRTFEPYNYITVDAAYGLERGVKFLNGNGAEEVAFLCTQVDIKRPYAAERQLAFYEAVIEHSMRVPRQFLVRCEMECAADYTREMERAVKQLFLYGGEPAKAVFLECACWYPAFIEAAGRHGFIPDRDFRLLVFDNPYGGFLHKGCCSIYQDYESTTTIIKEFISGCGSGKIHIRLKPQLIYGPENHLQYS